MVKDVSKVANGLLVGHPPKDLADLMGILEVAPDVTATRLGHLGDVGNATAVLRNNRQENSTPCKKNSSPDTEDNVIFQKKKKRGSQCQCQERRPVVFFLFAKRSSQRLVTVEKDRQVEFLNFSNF